jgi:predicted DNA-binding transcriptional regulator AlpA
MSNAPLPYPPPFQDLRTLTQHVCMSEDTIERLVKDGRFPEPRKNKCGKRLWVWKEVESYLSKPDDETPADEAERIRETVRRLSNA